jgi:hypothetical protein
MTDIHKTKYSPAVIQHPFASSGMVLLRINGEFQFVDITKDQENLKLWRDRVEEQIDQSGDAFEIYLLVNKPYALTFLKYALPHLSRTDMSRILASAWTMAEYPNLDVNLSKRQLVSLFKAAAPDALMDEEERQELADLESPVTIYRGVTPYNEKNVRALSWTLNYDTAKWFANRFDQTGTVYEAQVDKEHIMALFNGRNEAEVVVDPRYLMNVERRITQEMGMIFL